MSRHKGQVRFGYAALTPTYKTRLARRGITQRAWEDGADLRAARGHKPRHVPKTAIDQAVTSRLLEGDAVPSDFAVVKNATLPRWIPKELRADVKAALSQLPNPKKWQSVVLCPRPGGDVWKMTVTLNNQYHDEIEIEIPGGGEHLSGAWEILDLLAKPPGSREWENWSYNDLRIDPTCST